MEIHSWAYFLRLGREGEKLAELFEKKFLTNMGDREQEAPPDISVNNGIDNIIDQPSTQNLPSQWRREALKSPQEFLPLVTLLRRRRYASVSLRLPRMGPHRS